MERIKDEKTAELIIDNALEMIFQSVDESLGDYVADRFFDHIVTNHLSKTQDMCVEFVNDMMED